MRVRTGRRNGRNLYLQLGDEPSNTDPCIGFMVDDGAGALIAGGLTSPWHLEQIRLSAEARTDNPFLAPMTQLVDHEGAGSQGKHRSGGTKTEVPELSDGRVPPASCVEPWCLP